MERSWEQSSVLKMESEWKTEPIRPIRKPISALTLNVSTHHPSQPFGLDPKALGVRVRGGVGQLTPCFVTEQLLQTGSHGSSPKARGCDKALRSHQEIFSTQYLNLQRDFLHQVCTCLCLILLHTATGFCTGQTKPGTFSYLIQIYIYIYWFKLMDLCKKSFHSK